MVTYVCTNLKCDHKEIIVLEIRIRDPNSPSEKICPKCGNKMKQQ